MSSISGLNTLVPSKFYRRIAGAVFCLLVLVGCGGGSGGSDTADPPDTGGTVNTAPVADAGDDIAASLGETINLDGSGSSDVDNDILLYSWSLASSPVGSLALLNEETTSTPSITVDEVGSYVVNLVVNDGSADSPPDSLTITVTENTSSASITSGLGTEAVANLFPSGVRPSPLGSIDDANGISWTLPADVNFQDASFPTASDLYNPYGDQHANEIAALAALDSSNIVEIDASGELITAYIYADNYFEMYVNGLAVGKDAVPFTDFNSSIIQFRVEQPFTVAMLLVDWEENLGTGTESNGGSNRPGDGGVVAVFKDSTDTIIGITDGTWRAQTFYIAPIYDLSCLSENSNQRLSSTCSTGDVSDLSAVNAAHWELDATWMNEDFDDSDWPLATTFTNADVGIGTRPSYNNFTNVFDDGTLDAEFIWSTNLDLDNEVAIRKVIGL